MTVHDVCWPDGRRIVTYQVASDTWDWWIEDGSFNEPGGEWFDTLRGFPTEEDALAAARMAIADEVEARRCADYDDHGVWGCKSCGMPPL
jgi:hypothetical protein